MKTTIKITGQVSGNFTLLGKMRNYTKKTNGQFNSFTLHYDSISEAKNDIKTAYKSFINEETEFKSMISKSSDSTSLKYDASYAKIE